MAAFANRLRSRHCICPGPQSGGNVDAKSHEHPEETGCMGSPSREWPGGGFTEQDCVPPAGQTARWEALRTCGPPSCALPPQRGPCARHRFTMSAPSPPFAALRCGARSWFLFASWCHAGLCPHRLLPDPGPVSPLRAPQVQGLPSVRFSAPAVASCARGQHATATPQLSRVAGPSRGKAGLFSPHLKGPILPNLCSGFHPRNWART